MWVEDLVSSNSDGLLWEALPGDRKPDLVLMFGATDTLRQSGAARLTASQFPTALHLACSSGTTTNGRSLFDDGVRALAVGFDRTRLRLESMQLSGAASSRAVGETLGAQLAAPDLAAVFVLSAGLNVNGSALVQGLAATLGDKVTVSGGLAGDGARFADTLVSVGGRASDDVVAAIGFYGDAIRVSHGSAGGWDEFGPTRKVTRSEGNVVYELDGKPALDLYERYLGPEAAGLPASGLLYPLSIGEGSGAGDRVVRTILAVDPDARSLTFAGTCPKAGTRA